MISVKEQIKQVRENLPFQGLGYHWLQFNIPLEPAFEILMFLQSQLLPNEPRQPIGNEKFFSIGEIDKPF